MNKRECLGKTENNASECIGEKNTYFKMMWEFDPVGYFGFEIA